MNSVIRQVTIVVAITSSLTATSVWGQESFLTTSYGYQATEYLVDADFDAFSMIDSDTVLLYVGVGSSPGIEVVDLYSGEVQYALTKPVEICDGATRADDFLSGSFVKQDPDNPNTYWIGFTANNGEDGWIYKVDSYGTGENRTSTWTQIATMPGNYDLVFSDGPLIMVSANPNDITNGNNQILALDTSGGGNHTTIAEVGGFSAEIGVNAAGDVYYATYANWGTNEQLLRFSSEAIADALSEGGSPCEGEVLCNLTFGGNGMAVDDAGHVLISGNPGGYVTSWDDESGLLSTIATATNPSTWIGNIEVLGDITCGGEIYVTAWNQGIVKITKLIPGDANGDGTVDGSDVTILAGNWQETGAAWADGDFNGDGKVDGSDVTILAGNWQASIYDTASTTATTVPEPSMIIMLLGVMLAAGLIRR